MVSPAQRRAVCFWIRENHEISERRVCNVINHPRSTQRYQVSVKNEEKALVSRMHELVRENPRYGYRRICILLRTEGWRVNVKRVHRLWKKEGLKLPSRKARRKTSVSGHKLKSEHVNHIWAWDFVFDRTHDGRQIKILTVIDEYTKRCLALEARRSITGADLVDILTDLIKKYGTPKFIRSDNGSEFISNILKETLHGFGIELLRTNPGSPWENGCIESFNSKLRDEVLNGEVFGCLQEAQCVLRDWQDRFNNIRPHSALNYQTPNSFTARRETAA